MVQSPSPALGEGFRVREVGIVAHRVKSSFAEPAIAAFPKSFIWYYNAAKFSVFNPQ
ncbi:hypothetical protein AB3R30_06425 [Leptolyngbyaceae cyanobacterium UHCC 1019]